MKEVNLKHLNIPIDVFEDSISKLLVSKRGVSIELPDFRLDFQSISSLRMPSSDSVGEKVQVSDSFSNDSRIHFEVELV